MGKVKYVDIPKGVTFQEVIGKGINWVMLLHKTEDNRTVKQFVKLPDEAVYQSITQPYDEKIGVIYTVGKDVTDETDET